MCCKCCQNCLESFYWHVFEKHFCYDESIALYEEEEQPKKEEPPVKKDEKNNNMYDNLAFYDNVAIIAKSAIFANESPFEQKYKSTPITQQPQRTVAFEPEMMKPREPPKPPPQFIIPTIHEEMASTFDISNISSSNGSLATIAEENLSPTKKYLSASANALLSAPVKLRKKSLHERRVSKSLTLNIEKTEIPIIRQSSFPKFYLDTPEGNQTDFSILRSPVTALETPIIPNRDFSFDLRSVVQIENEKVKHMPTHVPKENRLSQIKDKLKPLKLLRTASSNSIHNVTHS